MKTFEFPPPDGSLWSLLIPLGLTGAWLLGRRALRSLREARAAERSGERNVLRLLCGFNGILVLLALFPTFAILSANPIRSVTLHDDRIEVRYRRSADRIAYAEMSEVWYEVLPDRRGRKKHELRIYTAGRARRAIIVARQPRLGTSDNRNVAAIDALARELKRTLPEKFPHTQGFFGVRD